MNLELIINETGLDTTKKNVLLENFANYFQIAEEWRLTADNLIITSADQVDEMKQARSGRLFLKEKRVLIEKTRKELKEASLNESRAIDKIAGVLKDLIEPIEKELEQKENFAKIQTELQKNALRLERSQICQPFARFVPYFIDLAELDQAGFEMILEAAKARLDKEAAAVLEMAQKQERERFEMIERIEASEKKAAAERKEASEKMRIANDKTRIANEKFRIEREKVEKIENEKRLEAEREAKRIEDLNSAPDLVKLKILIKSINDIDIPAFSTKKYSIKGAACKELLNKVVSYLEK